MRIEKIYFNTEDNAELFGLLHTSENQTDKEVVIAIHGMGSNCFKQRDDIIAQKLTSNNISYFSFNNRGFGLVNKITKNGECLFIDFSKEFIENQVDNIETQGLAISQIVNTMTQFTEINSVKILIDGKENQCFKNSTIKFERLFTKED